MLTLDTTPEEQAFRREIRSWLLQNLPAGIREKTACFAKLDKQEILGWQRQLAERGWAAPEWPQAWGGTGWSVAQRFAFEDECAAAGAPTPVAFGLKMCGPVLLRFGNEMQQKRFLPRIYRGDDLWCQGYSEPGAGSDLASLRTRAVRSGGRYVVNGQKLWTTLGHMADWIFCLVRTGAETGRKQEGISFLLMDMKTPGITVRPIELLDGEREVNEVFFDDVEVPVENLVHEEGQGWTVAKYLLGYERMNAARIGQCRRELHLLHEMVARQRSRRRPLAQDARFMDRLARTEIDLLALEITSLRYIDAMQGGRAPGPEVSLLKTKGSELQQSLTELMMQAAGPLALPVHRSVSDADERLFSRLAPRYGNFRKTSIYGGSNEIQRNILAKLKLGL